MTIAHTAREEAEYDRFAADREQREVDDLAVELAKTDFARAYFAASPNARRRMMQERKKNL